MTTYGIDISYWQTVTDWKKVKEAGVKFVILREGYRNAIDKKFLEFAKGATAANIEIRGVYHFIYWNGATIKENAKSTVENMRAAGLDPTTTWIFADLEYDSWKKAGETATKTRCMAITKEYCEELEKLGCKKVGIYANNDYYRNFYDKSIFDRYPLWLADYEGDPDHACIMQQKGNAGRISGITGLVDEDVWYTQPEDKKENDKMTEKQLREKVAGWLEQFAGVAKKGSANHKKILDIFNKSGLCTRYTMTVNDAWCATATSAAFIACGLAGKAGSGALFEAVECSCGSMIDLAKKQGIWVESDSYVPQVGDVVLYDWDDSGVGNCTGWPEHVGVVCSVSNSGFSVIEGNKNSNVGYREMQVNGKYIRGFITPNYKKFATTAATKPTTQTTTGSSTASKPVQTKKVTATGYASKFNKSLAGTYKTTDALHCRNGAGTTNRSLVVIPKGTKVQCYGYYSMVGKTKWLYIQFTLNGVQYTGFSSADYLRK